MFSIVLMMMAMLYVVQGYMVPRMVFGDILKKAGLKKDTIAVEFTKGEQFVTVQAKKGDSLSAVAEAAGVEIKYKCKKGECGTCEVNVGGKWVKACQTSIDALPKGVEALQITVKDIQKAPEKAPSKFFSPASFVEGVVNNGLGVVGFVQVALKADDEFNARMKREAELAAKVEAAKKAKMEAAK